MSASFEGIERGFAQVRDLAGGPRGLVRVTAPVAFGRQRLVPLLPAFLQAHPGVRVELDLSDRLQSLTQEGFDLAIRHTTEAPQTHVAWRLCSARTLLVASRAYLRRKGRPETPHDLASHDCLYYLRGRETPAWSFEPLRGRSRSRSRSRERVSVAVRGPFAANNSEAVREAALAGAGIALLPDFSAQREVEEGRLVPLLEDWRPHRRVRRADPRDPALQPDRAARRARAGGLPARAAGHPQGALTRAQHAATRHDHVTCSSNVSARHDFQQHHRPAQPGPPSP